MTQRLFTRTWFRRFLYYCLIILLPLALLGILVSSYFYRLYEGQVLQAAQADLELMSAEIDQQYETIIRLPNLIAMDVRINRLLRQENLIEAPSHVTIQTMEVLAGVQRSCPFIRSTFLLVRSETPNQIREFVPERSLVYSATGRYSYPVFVSSILFDSDSSVFVQYWDSELYEGFFTSREVIYDWRETRMFYYLQGIPAGSARPEALILLVFDQVEIESKLDRLADRYHARLTVSRDDEHVLFSSFDHGVAPDDKTLHWESAISGWQFRMQIPDADLRVQMIGLTSYLISFLGLSVLIWLILALFLSAREYRQLQRLQSAIRDLSVSQSGDRRSWDSVTQVIHDNLSRYRGLYEDLLNSIPTLRASFLRSLLMMPDPEPEGEQMRREQIIRLLNLEKDLDHTHFAILLVQIAAPDAGDSDLAEQSASTTVREMLWTTVTSIFQQANQLSFFSLLDHNWDEAVILAAFDSASEEELDKALSALIRAGDQATTARLNLSLSLTAGMPVTRLPQLPLSLASARKLLAIRFLIGPSVPLLPHAAQVWISKESQIDEAWKKRFADALGHANADLANQMVADLAARLRQAKVTPQRAVDDLLEVRELLLKLAEDWLVTAEEAGGEWPLPSIEQDTLDQQAAILSQRIDIVSAVLRERLASGNTALARQIIGYIRQNYTDGQLSLIQIAGEFTISVSYLSRMMKEYLGVGLNQYINELRIRQAKTLLSETRLTLQEIAERCGFNSAQNFARVFQKYEQLSPTTYRRHVETAD